MNREEDIFDRLSKGVDRFVFTYWALNKLVKVNNFREWLHNNKIVDEKIFEGYKFLIETIIRILISAIEDDTVLGIKEDVVFNRARFIGKSIKEVPNTCEKTMLIKSIWNVNDEIQKQSNWDKLNQKINSLDDILNFLKEIYKSSKLTIETQKDLASEIVASFYLLVSLHDTHKGIPLGYLYASTIPRNNKPTKRFYGYATTLRYLWHNFKHLKLNVHEIDTAIDNIIKKCNEEVSQDQPNIIEDECWELFDSTFGVVKKEIERIETQYKLNLGIEPLFIIEEYNKRYVNQLVEQYKNTYKKEKITNEIEKLKSEFLWYDCEVLNTTSRIFGGVPALLSVLIGLTKLTKGKVNLKIIKHEDGSVSYAILIPVFGTTGVTDYSGWLVSFSAATTNSGSGEYQYHLVEETINQLKNKLLIKRLNVDKKIFKKFLEEVSTTSIFDRVKTMDRNGNVISVDLNSIRGKYNNMRGMLFELLVAEWVRKFQLRENNNVEIYHDVKEGGNEIDIIATQKDSKIMHIFECALSINQNNVERRYNQIKSKLINLRKMNPNYDIIPHIIVYSTVDDDTIRQYFEQNNIIIKDNFANKVQEINWVGHEYKRKIRHLLEEIF